MGNKKNKVGGSNRFAQGAFIVAMQMVKKEVVN
jgi:hypothetical protein